MNEHDVFISADCPGDNHPFEDDTDFPVTRYTCWVNVRDPARITERQLAIAWRVFDAARDGAWSAMLSYSTQGNIALYP